ncbi:hypothetical protein EC968_007260 [Mortierella alpina]|nr:hypothetical protein EC968_007260 [Mortierella alpina]
MENQSKMTVGRSPVNYSPLRQDFHLLPPSGHNFDNGTGVSPHQNSVRFGSAGDRSDIKGKGKKRCTAPSTEMGSSTLGSRVQSRIFGNGNPYMAFHSLAHPTSHSVTPANAPYSGSGSNFREHERLPIPAEGVRHQVDDRIAIMPLESGLSKPQASGFTDDVEKISSTITPSANARPGELPSVQNDNPDFTMHSQQTITISATANSRLAAVDNEIRPRSRKTLSLEWCPTHKTLTTSVPPLRFEPKRSVAPINDSSSYPKRLAHGTRSTSASDHSSQRVKGPGPIPNFKELQNQKQQLRAIDTAGLTTVSLNHTSIRSQPETTDQEDSNLILIKRTSTVPYPTHLQHRSVPKRQVEANEQSSPSAPDWPSTVLAESSRHDAQNAEELKKDVQQSVADTNTQKTNAPYSSAPIPIPIAKDSISRHPPVNHGIKLHTMIGAGAPPEAPSSTITSSSAGTSNKRLSNTTSRGTARRIIYSADLEQGLPEGRIVRESNFEIVPSNRISISSRTNSSAMASRCYTRPSQFAEGVDIQGFSTATIVVQSNKRGIGRVRSSDAAQRPNNATMAAVSDSEQEGVSPLLEPVDLHGMSDSDEELDAARYKAEVLKRAAEEAASAANAAAAKASVAAAEVAEAKAARRRLRDERALKAPIQAFGNPYNDPAASKNIAGN